MPFNDTAYTYRKNYYPLYDRVLKFSHSKYPYSFSLCPILLFKKTSGSTIIFDHNVPYKLWKIMFKHKLYGIAFFAYHTAIIECYPRIIWHTYHPFFSLVNENIFYEISLLHSTRRGVKNINIRHSWYSYMANDISKLQIYNGRINRSTAWRLFIASLQLYNDVIISQRSEHDRLFLMPAPGSSWSTGMIPDRNSGRCFAEAGVSDYQDGERLNIEGYTPRIVWPEKAPAGWTLDKFFPVE
ncbi:MAG: hypothetical protein LBP61_01560 [Desulfovibrio sp.]|jgi:hypothetical protein|nr:hypothetical protein [Desulfovibrio sp.]